MVDTGRRLKHRLRSDDKLQPGSSRMTRDPGDDLPVLAAPLAQLERELIEEYIKKAGCDPRRLSEMQDSQAKELLTRASAYASGRLSEVEARRGYVHDIHGLPD